MRSEVLPHRPVRRAAVVDLVDRVVAGDGVGGHRYRLTTRAPDSVVGQRSAMHPEARRATGDSALFRSGCEEVDQDPREFLRGFLGHVVAAVDRLAINVVGPPTPDRDGVVLQLRVIL